MPGKPVDGEQEKGGCGDLRVAGVPRQAVAGGRADTPRERADAGQRRAPCEPPDQAAEEEDVQRVGRQDGHEVRPRIEVRYQMSQGEDGIPPDDRVLAEGRQQKPRQAHVVQHVEQHEIVTEEVGAQHVAVDDDGHGRREQREQRGDDRLRIRRRLARYVWRVAHSGISCNPRNTWTPDSSSAAAPIHGWTARARGSRSMRRETSAARPYSTTSALPTWKWPLAASSRSRGSIRTLPSPRSQLATTSPSSHGPRRRCFASRTAPPRPPARPRSPRLAWRIATPTVACASRGWTQRTARSSGALTPGCRTARPDRARWPRAPPPPPGGTGSAGESPPPRRASRARR